jgi:acetate kinase
LELFAYVATGEAATMLAALGGLDALAFTAGIGEHAAAVRARILDGLAWAGIAYDPAANAAGLERISPPEARIAVLIVPTDEDAMLARHALRLRESLGG